MRRRRRITRDLRHRRGDFRDPANPYTAWLIWCYTICPRIEHCLQRRFWVISTHQPSLRRWVWVSTEVSNHILVSHWSLAYPCGSPIRLLWSSLAGMLEVLAESVPPLVSASLLHVVSIVLEPMITLVKALIMLTIFLARRWRIGHRHRYNRLPLVIPLARRWMRDHWPISSRLLYVSSKSWLLLLPPPSLPSPSLIVSHCCINCKLLL